MPRIRTGPEEGTRVDASLLSRLALELKNEQGSGQPRIYEHQFPTGKIRVNVIWDEWDHLPLEERTEIILRAYEQAEGRTRRERIALASGLTFPEAHAAGMLPHLIRPAIRKGDPVSLEECHDAMIQEGASILGSPGKPQLRFASEVEAKQAVLRLVTRLPASEHVWCVDSDWLGAPV